MRRPVTSILAFSCLLSLAACSGGDGNLRNTVVLHYQHVANVHRINFDDPVALGRHTKVQFVTPFDPDGFWAVFVLCSIDATGAGIPSFYFDVDRFRIQYEGHSFGPLRPYTLRLEDTFELNKRADDRALADAIAAEVQRGPSSQVVRHGHYPDLDVRFAIYVPGGLPGYAGNPLALRYEGGQTLVLGNDYPPSDVEVAGLGGTGIAAHCLP